MILQRYALALAFLISPVAFFHSAHMWAQPTATSQPSPYTFHADTNVVLTDVTVADAKGNPVHGLPQSAFHIFDNNQPEAIASFEEHAGIPPAAPVPAESSPGLYSNDYLLHLPPVLNVLLIDVANLSLADQMYLNYELTKFLNERPENQPLALYLRAGSGVFLVQNFTSDRKLLLAGLQRAIPRFPPLGREYLSDFDTLNQVALDLSQLPGRKNVLWFSGGSTLYLTPDAASLQNDSDWRALYDELDQERIAIYPIDARGLTVASQFLADAQQHMAMNGEARATGGEVFYNSNGLTQIAEHLLDSDSSFYTLTYSPHNLRFNNKWHKVRVAVDGAPYHLSYRSGYFADGSLRHADQPSEPRTRLLSNGEKLQVLDQGNHPIIFQAIVLPASDPSLASRPAPSGSLPPPHPKKHSTPFSVRYTLPLDALTLRDVDGKHQVVFGVAFIALNRDGSPKEHSAEQITMSFAGNPFSVDAHPPPITFDEQLGLAKDDQFLTLGVWDVATGRFGSIQLPLEIPKSKQGEKPVATK